MTTSYHICYLPYCQVKKAVQEGTRDKTDNGQTLRLHVELAICTRTCLQHQRSAVKKIKAKTQVSLSLEVNFTKVQRRERADCPISFWSLFLDVVSFFLLVQLSVYAAFTVVVVLVVSTGFFCWVVASPSIYHAH